jgi:hypothetical protein
MAGPLKLGRAINDPEWVEWARVKEKKNLQEWPELKPLQEKLLSLCGDWVALQPECDLKAILDRGRIFSGKIIFKKLASRNCHGNCCELWVENVGRYRIATGWALSTDGIWRQHTWLLSGKRIIETTEPRIMYYGIELSDREALRFLAGNTIASYEVNITI